MRTRSFREYVKRQDRMSEAALQELSLGGMASGAMNWARGLFGGQQQQPQQPQQPQWNGDPSQLPMQMQPQQQGQNLPLQQQQGPGANLQAQPQNNLPLQWSKPDAQANQQMIDALKFYQMNPTIKKLRQNNPNVEQGWQKLASGWKEFKSAAKQAMQSQSGGAAPIPGAPAQ